MPRRRRSGENKNITAENRTYSFRLDINVPREQQAREILDAWIADAAGRNETMRDVIVNLILHYADADPGALEQQRLTEMVQAQVQEIAAEIRESNQALVAAIDVKFDMVNRVLRELRRNPEAFQGYVERQDGENDTLDNDFIANLLSNLER